MSVDLAAVAGRVLERDVVSASVTERAPVAYDPYVHGRVVERVAGVAELPNGEAEGWRAIVKQTRGAGLRAARRELAAYRHGVASAEAVAGLRAPRLLAWSDEPGHAEIWLEHVRDDHEGRWPVERFAVAARHIAYWDARAQAAGLPGDFDSEDAWAERHGQPHRVREALAEMQALASKPDAGELAGLLGDPGYARTRALIVDTQSRIAELAKSPQSPLHHDLVRSNLFAVGDTSTVAIDWENVGRGPLGVDLAPLVVGSVRRGEASSEHLPEIEERVLDAYVDGLRETGVHGDHDVRRAYAIAVGLRWHVVLGTIRSWLDPKSAAFRGSALDEPRTEALRHLVALSRHIVERAVT